MMKDEFERIAKTPISNEDYAILEKVYMFHPCISNTDGKKQVAKLYDTFGMRIIKDMFRTAQRCEDIDNKIYLLQSKIRELEQEKENYIEECQL